MFEEDSVGLIREVPEGMIGGVVGTIVKFVIGINEGANGAIEETRVGVTVG